MTLDDNYIFQSSVSDLSRDGRRCKLFGLPCSANFAICPSTLLPLIPDLSTRIDRLLKQGRYMDRIRLVRRGKETQIAFF